MPVSDLSFSGVDQYRKNKDASVLHISTASSPDGGTGALLFGRKPEKRRNSTGLNARLNRLLVCVNTSYASDLMAPGGKRPRNPSNCSSSSTVVSEATETPTDSVHSALKSNSLGDGFEIIKAGSSPDKARLGFVLNTDVPSWRDTDKETGAEREKSRRALPSWLSETFSSLEPDHPLRSLARHTHYSADCDDDDASSRQEHTTGTDLPEETHEEPIFAFAPPTANSAPPEAASSTTDVDEHAFRQYFNVENAYGVANDGRLSTVPAVEPHDYDSSVDAVAHGKAPNLPEGPVPFSQPGPFSRKTVHFMTPVRSSPLSFSNSASNQSWSQPTLSSATHPNRLAPGYKPYSTPGPASNFSLSSSLHSISDPMSASDQDYSSDYETQAGDNVFSHSPNVDTADSILSFDTSTEHSKEKAFSIPGPAFCVPSVRYLSSPNEDSLFDPAARQAHDDIDIELEIEPLLLGESDKAEMMHFVAPGHVEIAKDRQELKSVAALNATLTLEEINGGGAPFVEETESAMDYIDVAHHALEPESEPSVFTPAEPESESEPAPPIELFSSPPYIRFTRNFEEDSNEAGVDSLFRTPRFKPTSTARARTSRNVYGQEARSAATIRGVSSPYTRLDHLPSPAGGRNVGDPGDIVRASPRTPQSQPCQTRTRIDSGMGRDSTGDLRVLTSATIDIGQSTGTGTGAEVKDDPMEGKLRLVLEPEQPKPRRAFAPAPGIYLSPIRESVDGDSKADQNNEADDGGPWNISLSQLSEDSIENWET